MPSYQYRKTHKTVVRSSYLHNGISYTGKMGSLYSISPLVQWNRLFALIVVCYVGTTRALCRSSKCGWSLSLTALNYKSLPSTCRIGVATMTIQIWIKTQQSSLKKIGLKISSAKCFLDLNVLINLLGPTWRWHNVEIIFAVNTSWFWNNCHSPVLSGVFEAVVLSMIGTKYRHRNISTYRSLQRNSTQSFA